MMMISSKQKCSVPHLFFYEPGVPSRAALAPVNVSRPPSFRCFAAIADAINELQTL